MPDLQIVLCAPLAEIAGLKFDPATAPYSTYTQVECPHCRQGMWLGQRSRELVETGKAQMMCMVCAVTLGVAGHDTPIKGLVKE
jgi:hypothetical protein